MTHQALVESPTGPPPLVDQRGAFLASMSEPVDTSTPAGRKSAGLLARFGKKRTSQTEVDAPKLDPASEKRAKTAGKSPVAAAAAVSSSSDLDSTLESDQVLNPPPVAASVPGPGDGAQRAPAGPGAETAPSQQVGARHGRRSAHHQVGLRPPPPLPVTGVLCVMLC